ncbi:MAG: DsbA family protein, partial [Rhizobiales bacterium]|nr:DsbA family protein [Hyphomicrobiales bacterium]
MKAISIDVISDVICPWCFLGKRRLDKAIALLAGVKVEVNWR